MRQWVDCLCRPSGSRWFRRCRRAPDASVVLRRIARAREPGAIPYLFSALRCAPAPLARAIADVIGDLSSLVPARQWMTLDAVLRESSSSWPGWTASVPELCTGDLHRLANLPNGVILLGLASGSPDGHVRERAVLALAKSSCGRELPFLLVRLNDWVEPVRELARTAVTDRLHSEYAPHFVAHLPLVDRLTNCLRDDHRWLLDAVVERLEAGPWRDAVLNGSCSPDRHVRRACFDLLSRSPAIDVRRIVRAALEDVDVGIKMRGARLATSRLPRGDPLWDALELMLRAAFSPIRRMAIQAAAAGRSPCLRRMLFAGLFDRSPAVRDVAGFHLNRNFGLDVAGQYRDSLRGAECPDLVAAIHGLGHTGTPEDVRLIKGFLDHELAPVRQSALAAVGRLDFEAAAPRLSRALADVSSKGSRQASIMLASQPAHVDGDTVWALFERARSRHVRINALRVIGALPCWTSAPWLIRACGHIDQPVAFRARQLLAQWLRESGRGGAGPSGPQLASANLALAENEQHIPTSLLTELRFALR